jgi:leucyl aminopeptidase
VEYKELLKTPFADIRNLGGPLAGAMTAGLFLQEFVPEGAAWVHLDIAGPFWRSKPWKYYGEGPTGVGVRTLAELARNWMELMHP